MWGNGGAQLGARKRCLEEEDGSYDGGRLVRQRAAGGEHGGLQGLTHGASAAANSALQVHGTSHYQQQQQQPSQPQLQHQNAFHVLMSASPIKVDGIVCRRSSKTVSSVVIVACCFASRASAVCVSACVVPQLAAL